LACPNCIVFHPCKESTASAALSEWDGVATPRFSVLVFQKCQLGDLMSVKRGTVPSPPWTPTSTISSRYKDDRNRWSHCVTGNAASTVSKSPRHLIEHLCIEAAFKLSGGNRVRSLVTPRPRGAALPPHARVAFGRAPVCRCVGDAKATRCRMKATVISVGRRLVLCLTTLRHTIALR